jgi:hypothetical protein
MEYYGIIVITVAARYKDPGLKEAFIAQVKYVLLAFDQEYIDETRYFLDFNVIYKWSMRLSGLSEIDTNLNRLRVLFGRFLDAYEATYDMNFKTTGG